MFVNVSGASSRCPPAVLSRTKRRTCLSRRWVKSNSLFRDGWKQHTTKPCEGNGHCRNRAGLNHDDERPAVKEAPERRQAFTQENILAARLWKHGRQLAIGKRRRPKLTRP